MVNVISRVLSGVVSFLDSLVIYGLVESIVLYACLLQVVNHCAYTRSWYTGLSSVLNG